MTCRRITSSQVRLTHAGPGSREEPYRPTPAPSASVAPLGAQRSRTTKRGPERGRGGGVLGNGRSRRQTHFLLLDPRKGDPQSEVQVHDRYGSDTTRTSVQHLVSTLERHGTIKGEIYFSLES